MKKLSQAAELGGAPINKKDLRELFQLEIWEVIEGMLGKFTTDVQGVILKGVTITGAGPYDSTAGIVFIDGEFLRLPAQTGFAMPQYIVKKATSYESREMADGSMKNIVEIKEAELVNAIPGSGQYIAITSLTSADPRRFANIYVNRQEQTTFEGGIRFENSGPYIKMKKVEIGTWDMTTGLAKGVAHGIPGGKSKIVSIRGIIYDDDNGTDAPLPLDYMGESTFQFINGGVESYGDTNVYLVTTPSGKFRTTAYNRTDINRGHLLITYFE